MTGLPSLGTRLDSARAKLARAEEHVSTLKAYLQDLGKGDIYLNGTKVYEPGFRDLPVRTELLPPTGIETIDGQFLVTRPGRVRKLFPSIVLTLTCGAKVDLSSEHLLDGVYWSVRQFMTLPAHSTT